VRFRLSEAATVTLRAQGVKRTVALPAGAQRVRVARGAARVKLRAVDAAGNRSAPLKVRKRR
jgi:hypothetical protein